MGPLLFIVNPASGQTDLASVTEAIRRVMSEAGREHEILVARRASMVPALARQAVAQALQQGGAVVAVGGDGTLNAVAQAAVDGRCPFGVVSQGTFNYFGRWHGIPQEMEAALAALADARVEAVPVGTVNGRVFLVNASLGLYPKVLQDREAYKKQWGRHRWVAMLGAMMSLLAHDTALRIQIELHGKVHDLRTSTLFVCNNGLQLERLGLPHAERLQEGELAAVMLKPSTRLELLWLLLRGAFGRLGDADNVTSFPFAQMTVSTRRPRLLRVAADGEVTRLRTPLHFSMHPQGLLLLRPRSAPRP